MVTRAVAVTLIAWFVTAPAYADNMLQHGDFETPGRAAPDGWRFIINSDPKAEGQGTITIVPDADAPSGRHVAMIDKTDYPGYRPTLSTIDFDIEPGATYEFSALVKAEYPFYAGLTIVGEQPDDPNQTRFMREAQRRYPASPTYRRIAARYNVDPRASTGSITFYYNKRQGRMWIDDVRLTRVTGLAQPIETVAQPDAIHNLVELSVRSPFKPLWHLTGEDGWIQNDRTVFTDTGTGATIWKMSRHPDDMCRHQYQDIPPWNCNGQRMSLFALDAWRQIFMRPDGSAWRPADPSVYLSIWDRLDPDIWWIVDDDQSTLARLNVATGQRTDIRTFDGSIHVWPMSRDGKYLLVRNLVYDNGKAMTLLHLVPRDTSTGEDIITIDPDTRFSQTWFSNRDDYSVIGGYWDYWLGGEVLTPDGNVIKKITHQRMVPGGHRTISPDGKWAIHGMGFLYDWMTDETVWLSDNHTNHQTWGPDGTWLAGSVKYDLMRFRLPPQRSDQLLGSHNSRMLYSKYWAETHPAFSPDGTKLGYVSNMLGWIDFYNLIARLPDVPSDVHVEDDRIVWSAPLNARETARYRIYHAPSMTGPFALVDAVDVSKFSFAPGRTDGCFVVTAEEYSGLESNFSSPTWFGERPGALARAMEVEAGEYVEPANEKFDPAASNLYAMSLGDREPSAGVTLHVQPHSDVRVFARVRSILRDGVARVRLHVDGEAQPPVAIRGRAWHWVNLSGERRHAISASVWLVPLTAGVVVDQLMVVDDPGAVPDLFWGRNHVAPGPVADVAAEPLDAYAMRLTWRPPAGRDDIAHYNVYAARGERCAIGNETLIVSPTQPTVVDWGLQADHPYTYRITAVDRAGNEGAASEPMTLRTPAVADRMFVRGVSDFRSTRQDELTIPVDAAGDTGVVCWLKIKAHTRNDSVWLHVKVDGEVVSESYKIPFDFIRPHNVGPQTDVWLWVCVRRSMKDAYDSGTWLLPMPSGEHVLSLVQDVEHNEKYARQGPIDIECAEYVVTNDLGFVPQGRANFLLDPMRGRE